MSNLAFRDLRFPRLGAMRGGGFSPALLFAANEPGVWYDPSDLSTLFADTAGTTPATIGGTVALMLDKSKGLVLGPELVTNGTFDTDTAWTKVTIGTGPAPTITGGVAVLPRVDASNYGYIHQTVSVVVGQHYIYEVTASGAQVQVRVGNSPLNSAADAVSVNPGETVRRIFTATDSAQVFSMLPNTDASTANADNVTIKILPGFHATQPAAASRPALRQSGTGEYYLEFDGTDDFMVTPTITPGTDKVFVGAGLRKLSDAATGSIIELSSSPTNVLNSGTFAMLWPNSADAPFGRVALVSKGTVQTAAEFSVEGVTSSAITGIGDISGDTATLRVDGTQVAQSTSDQGTGNYLAYPMYIGRRGGTSFPFNGHIYSLITRFGPNLDADVIDQTEAYVASKTGIVL